MFSIACLFALFSGLHFSVCYSIPFQERQLVCTSQSQPNPIASTYPNSPTGVINGTIAVLPIPLSLARRLIPSEYGILTEAYRKLLPNFPKDHYPAVLQAVQDHDVQASGAHVPDFSRAGIEFPFVDLLNDNHTSFRWAPTLLMTSTNALAIAGATLYGTLVHPSTFAPSCDAYAPAPAPQGSTYFNAASAPSVLADRHISTLFAPLAAYATNPYPLSFYKNFTNQPSFADGSTCDNMVRLFNTSVSSPPYAPVFVEGSVSAKLEPFDTSQERVWRSVFGVRLATAFIEYNYESCQSLKGYSGTGSGD